MRNRESVSEYAQRLVTNQNTDKARARLMQFLQRKSAPDADRRLAMYLGQVGLEVAREPDSLLAAQWGQRIYERTLAEVGPEGAATVEAFVRERLPSWRPLPSNSEEES